MGGRQIWTHIGLHQVHFQIIVNNQIKAHHFKEIVFEFELF